MSSNITRQQEKIIICNFNHPKCVSDFLIALKDAIDRGYQEIIIQSTANGVFPNACVPIAGIMQFYMGRGIEFKFDLIDDSYLANCGFEKPYYLNREEIQMLSSPFDKIFKYDSSRQVADLTQAIVDAISHQSICENGVLGGLTWCLNEAMDNVLVHSKSYGLVMAQYHPSTKHIAICVFDSGIGIFETLKNSSHKPLSEIDALSMAIQEGVGDGQGQGNGLYGLYQIVANNQGRLSITSGSSSLMLHEKGLLDKFQSIKYISNSNKGTIIDFQLDLNKPINLKQIFYSLGGVSDFDFRLDNMLDENDRIRYDIFNDGQGTATREAGAYLRNDVENSMKRMNTGVILDFSQVKTVSSSFIDELVGKLVINLGFIKFNNAIKIIGMNEEISFLCERSVYMRIFESWKSTSPIKINN